MKIKYADKNKNKVKYKNKNKNKQIIKINKKHGTIITKQTFKHEQTLSMNKI